MTFEEDTPHPKPLDDDCEDEDDIDDGRKIKKRRAHYEKGTVERANWFRRYLATPHHISDVNIPSHPKAIEFCRNFSIPYSIYESLLHMTINNGWYDQNRRNVTGKLCSDIRLLLMGVLHKMADNASKYVCQTNTNISADLHRFFSLNWWKNMVSIRDNNIGMPQNVEDLLNISSDFDRRGLRGCCGSMDVGHRGWDTFPSEYTPLFKGKEGYPTVAFQVIVTHRKKCTTYQSWVSWCSK